MYKIVSAQEAVKVIKSNDRIYIQAAAAAPQILINAMTERASELKTLKSAIYILKAKHPMLIPI